MSDAWRYKTEEAIPCPFCRGESVSVAHSEVRYLGQNQLGVKKIKMKAYCVCNKCGARGTPVFYIGYQNRSTYDEEHLPIYSCGDEAIKKWNTREPMEQIAAIIADYMEDAESVGRGGMIVDMIEAVKEVGGI